MKYFDSIDVLKLNRWWKCVDGDYKYTRIDLDEGTEAEDWEAWCVIHDAYLNEFKKDKDEIDEIQEIRKRIVLLQCDYVIDNDDFLRNEIRRLTEELNEILRRSSESGMSREGFIIQLEKWIGFRLNDEEITARKYFSISQEFERELKVLNKLQS